MSQKIEVKKGDKYGDWIVIKEIPDKRGRIFLCSNSQGLRKKVWLSHLRSGKSKGFFSKGENNGNRSHGMTKTRIYHIWRGIKARCLNKNEAAYRNYGGRGIKVCPEWLSFEIFLEDMKEGYNDALTIERLDVNGDYCKENCTWIPKSKQNGNKRNNYSLNVNGKMMTIAELAKKYGIKYMTLYNRIVAYKMPIELALQKERVHRRFQVRPK